MDYNKLSSALRSNMSILPGIIVVLEDLNFLVSFFRIDFGVFSNSWREDCPHNICPCSYKLDNDDSYSRLSVMLTRLLFPSSYRVVTPIDVGGLSV
jgi:hypothetical protein